MVIYFHSEDNLIGKVTGGGISSAATTANISFTDRISGLPRIPDPKTRMFTIDKGSETVPNSRYETIYALNGHTTTAGVTTITTGMIRGLSATGTALTGGAGSPHADGAEVGCVNNHFFSTIPAEIFAGIIATGGSGIILGDGTNTNVTISHSDGVSTKGFLRKDPVAGKSQFSDDGVTWNNMSTVGAHGTLSNLKDHVDVAVSVTDTSVQGEFLVKGATTWENQAPATGTAFAKVSAGAADVNKIPVLDALGKISAFSSFAGEIKMYAGSVAPTGFLLCDGTGYAKTAYPDLFAAIGSTYGVGNSNAISFNGVDEYMANATDQSIGVANAFTWSVWINVPSVPAATGVIFEVRENAGGSINIIDIQITTTGRWQIYLLDSAGVVIKSYISTNVVADGINHNLQFSWDGTTLIMVEDGVEDTTPTKATDIAGTMTATNRSIYIANFYSLAAPLSASIARITCWSTARSAAQMITNYNGGLGVGEAVTALHDWRLGNNAAALGEDLGTGTAIDVNANSVNITTADIVFYAGVDTSKFLVPDFRGRSAIGAGTGDATGATAHTLGGKEGVEGGITAGGVLSVYPVSVVNYIIKT